MLLLALPLLGAPPAPADSGSSLTVVGTSDVSDSGLVENVLEPAFHEAYPQYTFKYIGTATGTAITSAESGSQGASVLIVHAPSLEARFISGGYSYERYGRAVFAGDFILAGPRRDPAGLASDAAHDIARALADIAAAGLHGRAEFVSRGGTPGTTVEEHALWRLVDRFRLAPPALLLCTAAADLGGGETPVAPGHGVTADGQPCPDAGQLPSGSALPAWYSTTGLTQGPNVISANACNGYPSGPDSCYVLSDRGTFDYLASGSDPAGSIPALKILVRSNGAGAPGGSGALVNRFHAYIVNPRTPGETVNLAGARALLDLITSPALQHRVGAYLAGAEGGAPFTGDASPRLRFVAAPRTVSGAGAVTVTGTLDNPEPGYPPLSHQPVSIDELEGGFPVAVAAGRTDARGGFRLRFTPPADGLYQVATPQLAQIEDRTFSPPFGDLLSPSASPPLRIGVRGRSSLAPAAPRGGTVELHGRLAPAAPDARARVIILARRHGARSPFVRIAIVRLRAGQVAWSARISLGAGRWQLEARYLDPGALLPAAPVK